MLKSVCLSFSMYPWKPGCIETALRASQAFAFPSAVLMTSVSLFLLLLLGFFCIKLNADTFTNIHLALGYQHNKFRLCLMNCHVKINSSVWPHFRDCHILIFFFFLLLSMLNPISKVFSLAPIFRYASHQCVCSKNSTWLWSREGV